MKQEEGKGIADNRLIAEFMGYYVTPYNGSYHFVCKEIKKPEHLNQAWEFRLEEAKYHSSWDWLMPVVEKIEGMGINVFIAHDTLFGHYCNIMYGVDRMLTDDTKAMGQADNKMGAIYAAVVQFIKHTNKPINP